MGGAFTKSVTSVSPLKRPELDCIKYTVRPAVREDIPEILWMIQLLAEHDGHRNVRKITEEDLLRDGFGDEKYFHCQVAELDGSDLPLAATTEDTALGANAGSRALPSQNVDADINGSQIPLPSQNVDAESDGSQIPLPSQNVAAESTSDGSQIPPRSQNVDANGDGSKAPPPPSHNMGTNSDRSQVPLPSQNVGADSDDSLMPPSQNVGADSDDSLMPPSQNVGADSDDSLMPPSQNVGADSDDSLMPPSQNVGADSDDSLMPPSQNVGADSSRLVGFVFYYYGYCTWEGRVAFIEDLFVKSQFRKKGIGLALFRACAQAAVSNRCVKLHLDVDVSNRGAMKWYKKLGAKEVDENLVDFELKGSSLNMLAAERAQSLRNRLNRL